MKKNKKIFKRVTNIIFYIIAFLALIIAAVFYYFVISLNMIPEKYIAIIIVLTLLIFILLVGLIILKKIKFRIKLISSIFLVLISLFFCLGIRYITKTISFMDIIDDPLLQKEEYQIMVLQNSNIKKTENLKDANVGVYNSVNADHAIDLLQMKVKVHTEHFDDITYMFEALESGKVDAVLVNNSIQNLLENELNYLELSLRSVSSVLVPIEHVDVVKVVDVTTTPFNVYIAGGDAYGSIGNVTNTDVNMIVSVDPVKKKMLLTSIPRDYYVRLPGQGDNAYDKLTHAGYYGVQESILAVEDLLDVEINYYVKVNFSTIEGIVDAIGGVDVYSDYSFCAYGLPTTCYFKGYNHLDGYHALIFARERHSFTDGDIQRVKDQQKVISAVINKVSKSTTIITNYTKILDSVSYSFNTNLDAKSIARLVKMQLSTMSSWSISNQNLVGYDTYIDNSYSLPNMNVYAMGQDGDSIYEAKKAIENFFK